MGYKNVSRNKAKKKRNKAVAATKKIIMASEEIKKRDTDVIQKCICVIFNLPYITPRPIKDCSFTARTMMWNFVDRRSNCIRQFP